MKVSSRKAEVQTPQGEARCSLLILGTASCVAKNRWRSFWSVPCVYGFKGKPKGQPHFFWGGGRRVPLNTDTPPAVWFARTVQVLRTHSSLAECDQKGALDPLFLGGKGSPLSSSNQQIGRAFFFPPPKATGRRKELWRNRTNAVLCFQSAKALIPPAKSMNGFWWSWAHRSSLKKSMQLPYGHVATLETMQSRVHLTA